MSSYTSTSPGPPALRTVAARHSVRYSRDALIIRLHRRPTPRQVEEISKGFGDLKVRGEFRVGGALPVEQDEEAIAHLPRLVFTFNRRDHGRLRMLIDHLNDLPDAPA